MQSRRSSRNAAHENIVRVLGLTTANGQRFFDAIHASQNRFLFRDNFRMDVAAFDALFELCQPFIVDTVRSQREVLAVALNWIGTAATCRSQEVLFDLTYSTVHKYRIRSVRAILLALNSSMKIPTQIPPFFLYKHPYFHQALGAIDGTHFQVIVGVEDTDRFRNHKGFVTTNVLVFCDWSLRVCFACAGAEGSAHDATVLRWSSLLHQLPEHYYVLGDAGYGLSEQVLTPCRGERYHLKEWAKNDVGRPRDPKVLFNLQHAKARNVVERTIGVLKCRFKVLRTCMDYEMMTIKSVIYACVLTHNFIGEYDASDLGADLATSRQDARRDRAVNASFDSIPFDFQTSNDWRSWIAEAMWEECQEFRADEADSDFSTETTSSGQVGPTVGMIQMKATALRANKSVRLAFSINNIFMYQNLHEVRSSKLMLLTGYFLYYSDTFVMRTKNS
ncbi:Nuclease HARBI1 [Phytophthora megakarya]|uniref:Nuclease HARBI1 n=1 Tax=Phytophthora megakarya TaxID=4795 RepID=A0A225V223_9STRA|nr:Nuclease HARBI1 [Phytophthora megakarya]